MAAQCPKAPTPRLRATRIVDVDEVEGAERPSRHWMAVEYLRNGDLAHLAQRAVHVAPFPNRVLWSFFLCLVRAAVGMARCKQHSGVL